MDKKLKERIAFEVLMILGALFLFCLIMRLWPLVFLVIPGILIAALRLLFISVKKEKNTAIPDPLLPELLRSDNEQDFIRIAFGVLQRRVTEQVTARYPAARWVWEAPNAMERFANGAPLVIILNRSGGFRKAIVQIHHLQFRGLIYESADTEAPVEPPHEAFIEDDSEYSDTAEAEVDYALIAFQWVEANLLDLNNRCNSAIADEQESMLIPAANLPLPDSWPDICTELTRSGFSEAIVQEDGIMVTLPE